MWLFSCDGWLVTVLLDRWAYGDVAEAEGCDRAVSSGT